jgi:hypothetical protein
MENEKMNHLEKARQFDEIDRPIEAIQNYEQAISDGDAPLSAYLDLALIYLNCCDFGYASFHKLPETIENKAYENVIRVLNAAEHQHGYNVETTFWCHLAEIRVIGNELSDNVLRPLLDENQSLVPYYFAFLKSDGKLYRDEARKLKSQVSDKKTSRQRYIAGILEKRI